MTHAGRPAGFATRAAALAVDGAIFNGAVILAGIGLALALSLFGVHMSTPLRAALGTCSWFALVGLYLWSFWTLTGQTPGMRFMGVRVVGATGGVPSRGQALRRVLGMALAALPLGAGFLPILVDDLRRGLHDRLAGTLVVHLTEGS